MNTKILIKLFFSLLLALLLTNCSDTSIQKFEGSAQGTTYHISFWSTQKFDHAKIQSWLDKEFQKIDVLLSNYRPDSVIETFNAQENTSSQNVGEEIVELVRIAKSVHLASQGCYDLTIKPLFDLWGFRKDSLNIPDEKALKNTLLLVGMNNLEVVDGTHLRKKFPALKVDLSSIAQGYSVERISKVLERQGITNYLVEIGGELKTQGHKPDSQPWRIAVEKPLPDTQQTIHKVVTVPVDEPTAIMTSGTYRHYFDLNGKTYSHILDARNGRPVSHDLVSVTVLHDNPTIADAWSTALLCLGQPEGIKVANDNNIAAIFIVLKGDQLNETHSEPLKSNSSFVIN